MDSTSGGGGGGGGGKGLGHFHMLGVRGSAARQRVHFVDMCPLKVYFLAKYSCLCSLWQARIQKIN